MVEIILAVFVILLTEWALSLSHMTWSHPWWRTSFSGFSDRWHALSFLSHWPIVLLVLWLCVPWQLWPAVAALSWLVWQGNKAATRKRWDTIWVQLYNWIKER